MPEENTSTFAKTKEVSAKHGGKILGGANAIAIVFLYQTFVARTDFAEHLRQCEAWAAKQDLMEHVRMTDQKRAEQWRRIAELELEIEKLKLRNSSVRGLERPGSGLMGLEGKIPPDPERTEEELRRMVQIGDPGNSSIAPYVPSQVCAVWNCQACKNQPR